jgi:hypothetical protein
MARARVVLVLDTQNECAKGRGAIEEAFIGPRRRRSLKLRQQWKTSVLSFSSQDGERPMGDFGHPVSRPSGCETNGVS